MDMNYYSRYMLVEFVVILPARPPCLRSRTGTPNACTWYQEHVRSNSTWNCAAAFWRPLGNGWYTIPAYVSAKFLVKIF